MSPPSSGNRGFNRPPCKAKLWRGEKQPAGRRFCCLRPPRTPAAIENQRREGGGTMRASAQFGVRKLRPPGESAAVARRWRGGRSRTERLQDSFALRIELLGFERQSRPGPCHVGQDGAHPQVRRTISHLPAFDGTLSALDRSNHRHPAAHAHRPRVVRRHYTTTATGLPTCNAVGIEKFMSYESDT